MSAAAMGALPEPPASLRPVPWRAMAWVTWRQHRLTLGAAASVFGALAAYLLITGLPIHHAYDTAAACRPARSGACRQVIQDFLEAHVHGLLIAAGLLQAVPVLVGAFAGAPLLAREFETGTFRYAWTQGFGRTRWTVAKLVPLALALTAAAAAFGVLFSWYYQPILAAGGGDSPPLAPTIFDLRGLALPAWTLAAFAIGVLAGTVIRRVIPALFATLAVWVALAFVTGAFLRPHYQAPLVSDSIDRPAGAYVMSLGFFKGGKPATLAMINRTLRPTGIVADAPTVFHPTPAAAPNFEDPIRYLMAHGYQQLTTYQPASRFWTFQWIEGAWLLALSLVLMTATVGLVHRRTA